MCTWEYPASSIARRAFVMVSLARARASSRESLAQEPVWTTIRRAPMSRAARAVSRMYRMLPSRLASSRLDMEM